MKLISKIKNIVNSLQSKKTKKYRKLEKIYLSISVLAIIFLNATGNQHVVNFIGSLLLFNLWIVWCFLGRRSIENNEDKVISDLESLINTLEKETSLDYHKIVELISVYIQNKKKKT